MNQRQAPHRIRFYVGYLPSGLTRVVRVSRPYASLRATYTSMTGPFKTKRGASVWSRVINVGNYITMAQAEAIALKESLCPPPCPAS